jgi:two-component system, NarL family, response regulator NreC
MLTILLADDHKVVRRGLRVLLSSEPDFKIVGEAENGSEALNLAEELKPDVMVLDLMMPLVNGLEVTRNICQQQPHPAVVILSMHGNEAYVVEAFKLGAQAYILKDATPEDLVYGIREAFAGRRYVSQPLVNSINGVMSFNKECPSSDFSNQLTRREEEVLTLAARGLSNKDISEQLNISKRTVETHRNNLMHKLNLHSQSQLTNLAIQKGLLSKDNQSPE